MGNFCHGSSKTKRWLLCIVAGTALLLLSAIAATYILARLARAEAKTYIRIVMPLRIGTAYEVAVPQLGAAGIPMTLPTDCRNACTLLFRFDNRWQHMLHLPPSAEFMGYLDFRDGKLVTKSTTMTQGIYAAEVTESTGRASRTSGDADLSGRPQKVFVDLSAIDYTDYRRQAYAFELACMGLVRGCKTDEFLPTVNELERATSSSVNDFQRATPSSIWVHEFAARSSTPDVIYMLAVKYHVVIGVYGTLLGSDYKTIEISIKNGPLKDALNAITKADPKFEWHEGSNGAVHFVSRSATPSLMDIRVQSFDIDNSQSWDDILDRLQSVPAVHSWFLKRKCPMDDSIMNTGGPRKLWGQFSVHARDLPVSSILDEIAAKSRSYYWSFVQIGTEPCAMEMVWRDPQP